LILSLYWSFIMTSQTVFRLITTQINYLVGTTRFCNNNHHKCSKSKDNINLISQARTFLIRSVNQWRTENTKVTEKRINNYLQNITQKTKDRATWTLLNTEGELRCSVVSSSCSTCGTRHYEWKRTKSEQIKWISSTLLHYKMVYVDTNILF
jgi:hypothetical protein